MRKFILLIPFFLFACKKNEQTPRITIRQQPSKIAVFAIDIGTGAQTLQYEINYFYNDSLNKFDSVLVDGRIYRFNYSQITVNNKILLNYTDAAAAYGEFTFDANFYSLKTYKEFVSPPAVNTTYSFQYNSAYQITGLSYTSAASSPDFTQSYTYNYDSIFVHTVRPADVCQSTDTIVNTYVNMSTKLPYLLFASINSTCGSIGLNILKALPVSNATNKFPSKIINGNTEVDFTYLGDSYDRLAQATVVTKERGNNLINQKLKAVVTY